MRNQVSSTENNITCLEFRRLRIASPGEPSAEAKAHMAQCAVCAAFAQRQGRVAAPPPRKRDRVQARVERAMSRERRRHRIQIRAFAAAGLLALVMLAIAVLYPYFMRWQNPAEAVIDRVLAEPQAMLANQRVSNQDVQAALARVGATLRSPIGRVHYLGDCSLPGGQGQHLVVDTPVGQVNLLLMPNQTLKSKDELSRRGVTALLAPAARGSYAVVMDSPWQLEQAEKFLNQHISWGA